MQIQQIETFVNIYMTRSFARTAETMFMSQSAISQALKSMENELGVKLFERTNHKVIPTERGMTFFSYAQNILTLYHEGESRLKGLKNNFYIHTQVYNYLSPINRALINLSFRHPDAQYKILQPIYRGNSLPADLMAPYHLYIVRENWISKKEVNFFSLGKPYYSVILKQGDPLADKETITISDILTRDIIMMYRDNSASAGGPYLGEIKEYLEKNKSETIPSTNANEMLSLLISSDYDTVAVSSNKMALSQDLPVVSKRLFLADKRDIGFAYIGEVTEYMAEFMEMAKIGLQSQDREIYF